MCSRFRCARSLAPLRASPSSPPRLRDAVSSSSPSALGLAANASATSSFTDVARLPPPSTADASSLSCACLSIDDGAQRQGGGALPGGGGACGGGDPVAAGG